MTDKVAHGYLPTYQRIADELGPLARVCEVGVHLGGSLRLWRRLFPFGMIAGVDCDAHADWPATTERIIAQQDDPGLPDKLAALSHKWNLIVDDASHCGPLSSATFELLWPMVAPGGYYALEDWMVGLGAAAGFPGWDESMLRAAANLLRLLTSRSAEADSITYTYGLAIVHKRR